MKDLYTFSYLSFCHSLPPLLFISRANQLVTHQLVHISCLFFIFIIVPSALHPCILFSALLIFPFYIPPFLLPLFFFLSPFSNPISLFLAGCTSCPDVIWQVCVCVCLYCRCMPLHNFALYPFCMSVSHVQHTYVCA